MSETNYNCNTETGVCEVTSSQSTLIESQKETTAKIKITYYYDALCGWCYGFTNAFKQFKEAHSQDIDFEVVSGGLFTGGRVGYINNVAPYIKQGAYKNVEQVTGVLFGKKFIDKIFGEGDILLNSLPPAIALSIVKENKPEKSVEFAELLLKAAYKDGVDLNNFEAYKPYLTIINFNIVTFNKKVTDEKYKRLAMADFDSFVKKQLGGMPTLLIEHKNKKGVLSNGYADYQELEKRLDYYLKTI
ncbi:putative protein-disulfide isomerase [Wenyingzhuangia heitensis]|uniref:DSBA-like thioredoxin domain-containing protein n=1 Tax=Wenyingzhuangia heitensis TaxID=1487859 RepID=A0ABX0UA51_9FLAO|nr:DsbA family protein [Wenyingzhuangia heitensis]NIJ45697.1 putative protein-disulfide isomerase [Wenyingzhuangia heitensis]